MASLNAYQIGFWRPGESPVTRPFINDLTMTNAELIATIRTEIERQNEYSQRMSDNSFNSNMRNFYDGASDLCNTLLSFLSTLESEKPMNQEEIDLKKELHDFIMEFGPAATFDKCASRFYELGCRRTAEKYDEIEYNRQMAEERQMEKEIPNDLEEAAEEYSFNIPSKLFHLLSEEQQILWKKEIEQAYLAGAKWQAEQDKETIELAEDHAYLAGAVNEREKILKEAVETEVTETCGISSVWIKTKQLKPGQKVRVIVCKNED